MSIWYIYIYIYIWRERERERERERARKARKKPGVYFGNSDLPVWFPHKEPSQDSYYIRSDPGVRSLVHLGKKLLLASKDISRSIVIKMRLILHYKLNIGSLSFILKTQYVSVNDHFNNVTLTVWYILQVIRVSHVTAVSNIRTFCNVMTVCNVKTTCNVMTFCNVKTVCNAMTVCNLKTVCNVKTVWNVM